MQTLEIAKLKNEIGPTTDNIGVVEEAHQQEKQEDQEDQGGQSNE